MTVFTSRVRHAYLKKRSKKTIAVFTLFLLALAAVFGVAGHDDEQDQQSMSQEYSSALRLRVVSRWTETGDNIDISRAPKGGAGGHGQTTGHLLPFSVLAGGLPK